MIVLSYSPTNAATMADDDSIVITIDDVVMSDADEQFSAPVEVTGGLLQGHHDDNTTVRTPVVTLIQYHSMEYRVVWSILVGLIIIVGLTGNASVVVVVYRTPMMRTPTNCYLVSLAVADVLLLLSAGLPTLIEYQLVVDEWVLGATGCSVAVFAQYLGVNVSSLTMTAFTVERYLAICHPLTVQTTDTARRARRVIVGLWTAGLVLVFNKSWPVLHNNRNATPLLLACYAERPMLLRYYLRSIFQSQTIIWAV
jgi:hypothetical protein